MLWQSLTPRRRWYFALLIMLLLNLGLTGARILFTFSTGYLFLLWNLFLAAVPFVAMVFARKLLLYEQTIPAFGFTLIGILFLPNAPYLITDLFHLQTSGSAPIWYDTVMIASCAATGLMLFYAAIRKLEVMLLYFSPALFRMPILAGVTLLCGYGIYLGRYGRFNSWDFFTYPAVSMEHVYASLTQPSLYAEAWGITFIYSAFLMVTYLVSRLLQSNTQPLVLRR